MSSMNFKSQNLVEFKSKILSDAHLLIDQFIFFENIRYIAIIYIIYSNRVKVIQPPGRFELPISCLLDRRLSQLSHGGKTQDNCSIIILCCLDRKNHSMKSYAAQDEIPHHSIKFEGNLTRYIDSFDHFNITSISIAFTLMHVNIQNSVKIKSFQEIYVL